MVSLTMSFQASCASHVLILLSSLETHTLKPAMQNTGGVPVKTEACHEMVCFQPVQFQLSVHNCNILLALYRPFVSS